MEPQKFPVEPYTFEQALALTKIGKFHWFHLLICGFCIMSMMNEVTGVSLIMSGAKIIRILGVVLGSQLLGTLADIEGRRKTLVVSMFISICSSVISSVAVNTAMLVIFRILTGFFVSAGQSITYSYLAEFHGDKTRARFITLGACFLPLASIYFP
uniref:Major facilitator superfamily (MFS) profile domain-containing protein n=1 Tax=Megaselia scalaris TaxID=36166 RepID=T1GRY8_MEGSC